MVRWPTRWWATGWATRMTWWWRRCRRRGARAESPGIPGARVRQPAAFTWGRWHIGQQRDCPMAHRLSRRGRGEAAAGSGAYQAPLLSLAGGVGYGVEGGVQV